MRAKEKRRVLFFKGPAEIGETPRSNAGRMQDECKTNARRMQDECNLTHTYPGWETGVTGNLSLKPV